MGWPAGTVTQAMALVKVQRPDCSQTGTRWTTQSAHARYESYYGEGLAHEYYVNYVTFVQ